MSVQLCRNQVNWWRETILACIIDLFVTPVVSATQSLSVPWSQRHVCEHFGFGSAFVFDKDIDLLELDWFVLSCSEIPLGVLEVGPLGPVTSVHVMQFSAKNAPWHGVVLCCKKDSCMTPGNSQRGIPRWWMLKSVQTLSLKAFSTEENFLCAFENIKTIPESPTKNTNSAWLLSGHDRFCLFVFYFLSQCANVKLFFLTVDLSTNRADFPGFLHTDLLAFVVVRIISIWVIHNVRHILWWELRLLANWYAAQKRKNYLLEFNDTCSHSGDWNVWWSGIGKCFWGHFQCSDGWIPLSF